MNTRTMTIKTTVMILLLLLAATASAAMLQNRAATQAALPVDSLKQELVRYEDIELPQLSVFLATAEQHPSIKTYEASFAAAKADMALLDRDWLGYVRFQANYQYGYNSYWSNGYLVEGISYDQNRTANHSYGVGVSVSFPLSEFFTRKYRRQKQQAEIDKLQYAYEVSLENRRMAIVEAYNAVVALLTTIQVKAEAAALYNAQMRITEQDFVNGRIDITSLSLERSRRSQAISDYEQSRVALHNAITMLELMTNIQIIRK